MCIAVECIYCATVRSSRSTLLLNTHKIVCHHLKVTQWTKTEEYCSASSSSVECSLLFCASYWNKLSRSFSLSPSTVYPWFLWCRWNRTWIFTATILKISLSKRDNYLFLKFFFSRKKGNWDAKNLKTHFNYKISLWIIFGSEILKHIAFFRAYHHISDT